MVVINAWLIRKQVVVIVTDLRKAGSRHRIKVKSK